MCRGAYRDDGSGRDNYLEILVFSFLCFGSGSAFCSVDFSALDSVFVGCVSAFVPPVFLPLLTVIGSLFGLVFPFFTLFFWVEFSALVPPVFLLPLLRLSCSPSVRCSSLPFKRPAASTTVTAHERDRGP